MRGASVVGTGQGGGRQVRPFRVALPGEVDRDRWGSSRGCAPFLGGLKSVGVGSFPYLCV